MSSCSILWWCCATATSSGVNSCLFHNSTFLLFFLSFGSSSSRSAWWFSCLFLIAATWFSANVGLPLGMKKNTFLTLVAGARLKEPAHWGVPKIARTAVLAFEFEVRRARLSIFLTWRGGTSCWPITRSILPFGFARRLAFWPAFGPAFI